MNIQKVYPLIWFHEAPENPNRTSTISTTTWSRNATSSMRWLVKLATWFFFILWWYILRPWTVWDTRASSRIHPSLWSGLSISTETMRPITVLSKGKLSRPWERRGCVAGRPRVSGGMSHPIGWNIKLSWKSWNCRDSTRPMQDLEASKNPGSSTNASWIDAFLFFYILGFMIDLGLFSRTKRYNTAAGMGITNLQCPSFLCMFSCLESLYLKAYSHQVWLDLHFLYDAKHFYTCD